VSTPLSHSDLSTIYADRFDAGELQSKNVLWRVLCQNFFNRYIQPTDTVLDLAAGYCEFINNVRCAQKIAVDLNPDTKRFATDARVVLTASDDLGAIESGTVDVVFTSNFFEHLPDKQALLRTLAECRRVLRPGGRLLVLMPNLRYLGGRYWDYFDHHLPLTHLSLQEGLNLAGFDCDKVIPRFLPYTVKNSRVPISSTLVRTYLRTPVIWRFFGRQMFVAAHSTDTAKD
jgi:SAM-dependent methyltransferase